MNPIDASRRPLKTRAAGWANALAGALVRRGVAPDTISLAGVGFAIAGAGALGAAYLADEPSTLFFVIAACCIQLRLLANMLDGMVAVEGGLGGPLGDIYNEFPDRLADVLFIVPAGYVALGSPWPAGAALGWGACTLALLTAYVRALAGGIGAGHPFHGPMAKPHRMFLLTLGCLGAAVGVQYGIAGHIMYVTLALMIVGMFVTLFRRLQSMARELKSAD